MQRRENAQDGIIDIIIVGMRVAMTTMRVFDIILLYGAAMAWFVSVFVLATCKC